MQKKLAVREDVADGNGRFEGARQVDPRVVGQRIGQRQPQRGRRQVVAGLVAPQQPAPVRWRNSSGC